MEEDGSINILILIPIFINDFLAIHPFLDGNGRISRLLTTLILLKNDYKEILYISLEDIILKQKDLYYNALLNSQLNWAKNQENPLPFIKYFLKLILYAYEDLYNKLQTKFFTKQNSKELVKIIIDKIVGTFNKSMIIEKIPNLSKSSIEKALKKLVEDNYLIKKGIGKATFYYRNIDIKK